MHVTPKIFVSATSGDLATARLAAVQALNTLHCLPVAQSHFSPDTRSIRDMLRGKIRDCQALIHIAGFRYGFDPSTHEAGEPHRSYTQLEFDTAIELGIPVYLFLPDEGFPFDNPDAPPEDKEHRALQTAHREALKKHGTVYTVVRSQDELEKKLRELQDRVEELQKELAAQQRQIQRRRKRITIGVAALILVLAGIAWGTTHIIEQNRQLKEASDRDRIAREKEHEENVQARKALDDIRDRLTFTPSGKSDLTPKQRYENALEEIAFANKMDKAQPLELIGKFTAKVESDPEATLADQARVAFNQQQYTKAARLGNRAGDDAVAKMQAAEAERDKQRRAAIENYTLSGQAEQQQAHYDAALMAFERAAALTDKGRDAAAWADANNWVALVLYHQAGHARAISLLEEIVPVLEKQPDPEAPKLATALNNLATLYQATNRLAEAEPLMQRALKIDEKSYGPEHPAVATRLNNLARLYQDTNRLTEAEPLSRRHLVIFAKFQRNTGHEHPHFQSAKANYADLLKDLGLTEPDIEKRIAAVLNGEKVEPVKAKP